MSVHVARQFLMNIAAAPMIVTSDQKHVNFKNFKSFNLNVLI
jgi:hypothetical protein